MRAVVGVVSLLLLAGCGSSPASTPAAGGTPATAQATSATPAASTAPAGPAGPLDAPGELAKLKAAGLPIGATGVTTAESDGNHLLGRPNGYTSKVYWTDTRVDQSQVHATSVDDVKKGGSIESYPDAAGAQARKDYIVGVLKAAPILGTEYDYLAGASLIRVSGLLTPDQAKQYEAAG
jgi:hypothetical protein